MYSPQCHKESHMTKWLNNSNNQLTFHKKMNLDDLGGFRMQSQKSLDMEKGGKRGSVRMMWLKRSNWPLLSLKMGEDGHEPRNLGSLSIQFSSSFVSDSLRPHELQHARPPCPSPTPGVHSNSRPSSRWCHPDISSSAVPFSSCPQSLPASGSFPMSQLFTWGAQSTGVSALASFFQRTPRTDLPLEWTGWISLQSKESSPTPQVKSLLQHHSSKASILRH